MTVTARTTPPGGARRAPLGGTEGALRRYRVMVMIVGTGLAILCFVGIPLQVAGGNKWPWTSVVEIVGIAHGIFYMVYLLTCLDLASRARLGLAQLLGMVCSGFLPLLAFFMERRVARRVAAQLALGPEAPAPPAVVVWAWLTGRRAVRESEVPSPVGANRSPVAGEADGGAPGRSAGGVAGAADSGGRTASRA